MSIVTQLHISLYLYKHYITVQCEPCHQTELKKHCSSEYNCVCKIGGRVFTLKWQLNFPPTISSANTFFYLQGSWGSILALFSCLGAICPIRSLQNNTCLYSSINHEAAKSESKFACAVRQYLKSLRFELNFFTIFRLSLSGVLGLWSEV